MDMVNLRHAKKAQALASDLDYRKKLHEYTVLPEDMKTQWARKAYGLQSEVSEPAAGSTHAPCPYTQSQSDWSLFMSPLYDTEN